MERLTPGLWGALFLLCASVLYSCGPDAAPPASNASTEDVTLDTMGGFGAPDGSPPAPDTTVGADTQDPPPPDTTEALDTQSGPPELGPVPWFFSIHASEVAYDLDRAALAFEAIKDLGGQGVRTDVFWWDVEPEDGQWNEERMAFYEAYADLARSHGLEPMIIVSGAPGWAVSLYQSDPEAFWARYESYVDKAITPFADWLAHVQIWNEPNHIIDPIGSEDDHQLFVRGAAIVRARAPGVRTYANVMANLVGWEEAVTDWVVKSGDAIDVIGIDHYPGTWTASSFSDWAPFDILITRINDPADAWYGKLGAVMETGYSSWMAVTADEGRQRDWINESLPVLRSRIAQAHATETYGIVLANYYQLIDVDTDGWGQEAHFGILHTDLSEKEGYSALRTQLGLF
jgi:hypothetical protein